MGVEQTAWKMRVSCRLDIFTLLGEFKHRYGSHDDRLDQHGLAMPEPSARPALSDPVPVDMQP